MVIVAGVFIGVNNTLTTQAVMIVAPVERPVASAAYGFVRFIGGGLAPSRGQLAEHSACTCRSSSARAVYPAAIDSELLTERASAAPDAPGGPDRAYGDGTDDEGTTMTGAQDRPRVLTAIDGEVWRITLDRPEAGNALDPATAHQLAAAFRNRPEAARAVLLLGNGDRFCVGGDVRTFAGAADPGAFVGQLAHDWHEVIRLVLDCPVPVVAGVQGAVAGAAVGLIGACDLVVCARSTKIRPAYGAIGLSPDGGTSWALTRALGAPAPWT